MGITLPTDLNVLLPMQGNDKKSAVSTFFWIKEKRDYSGIIIAQYTMVHGHEVTIVAYNHCAMWTHRVF